MKYLMTILAILSLASLKSQTCNPIELKGMVVDAVLGDPLIGAAIVEVGTRNGASTDLDGSFSLTVNKLPTELEFIYVGYESQILSITDTASITVLLKEGGELLEEVVVSGYARRHKKAKGKTRQIESTALPGKVAGVQMLGDHTVRIRGKATVPVNSENEQYNGFQENKFTDPLDEALSTFSIDVDRASYSNVRRFIRNGELPPTEAVRVEEMINYFNYNYDGPTGEHPLAIYPTLTSCPWNTEHQLLHIGLQGKKVATNDLPPSNIVFLIDVSGSMSDYNKLPLVQSSMKMLVNNLRPEDRVAIVTYAGSDRVVLESSSMKEKTKILDAIDQLGTGGSTAGAAGIKTAYRIARANFIEEGNNRIILATDGDFNVGIYNEDDLKKMIEKERASGVYLSILGYGMGNYRDDIMQTLAEAGNGNHAYIDDIQEADKVLIQEFGGTLFTIAKDVKFQLEFNPSQVAAYRLIGYESRLLNKEDFNNDKKDAGDIGSGHTVTAIYEIIPQGASSPYIGSVDELKYQARKNNIEISNSPEIATIKFRYKAPNASKSKKVTIPIIDQTKLENTSADLQWSIAVAAFGLKLKSSDYLGDYDYQSIIDLAKNGRGDDEEGYRAEMIRLIRSARNMTDIEN